jgi:hypothetical protein
MTKVASMIHAIRGKSGPKIKEFLECRRCGVVLPRDEFPSVGKLSDGVTFARRNECKPCWAVEGGRAGWRNNLMRKLGVTEENYNQMFTDQDGKCAICEEEQPHMRLAVDHDHETNEIRGLLCDRCNRGIGFMRDNPDLLIKAASYLMTDELEKVGGGSHR